MKESSRTLVFASVFYGLTLTLGVAAARAHILLGHGGIYGPTLAFNRARGVLIASLFIVSMLMVSRWMRSQHVTLTLLLLTVVSVGTHYVIDAFNFPPVTFMIALVVVCAATIVPRVIVHDIGIMFGIAGAGAMVGVTMTPTVAMAVMLAMAVYDFLSVYRGNMIRYAEHMLESGAVFGFIIPQRASGFFKRRSDALRSNSILLLGSTDIAMPLLLAAAVANYSIASAVIVAVGALFGLILVHVLLQSSKQEYIPALPPVATTTLLAYFASILLGAL